MWLVVPMVGLAPRWPRPSHGLAGMRGSWRSTCRAGCPCTLGLIASAPLIILSLCYAGGIGDADCGRPEHCRTVSRHKSWGLLPAIPTSSEFAPKLQDSCPRVARPNNSGQMQPVLADGPAIGQFETFQADIGQVLAEFGQHWPTLGLQVDYIWSMLAKTCTVWA